MKRRTAFNHIRLPILFIYLILIKIEGKLQDGSVRLWGGGATFPTEMYEAWMPAFDSERRQFTKLSMEYISTGSGIGKSYIVKGSSDMFVDYAGSDSVLTHNEYQTNPDLQMFPVIGGAVVLGYNLPGIEELILKRDHIVGIYNGSIHRWDDPIIQETNPNVTFPDHEIKPLARADISGTTEIFTTALSHFSSEWNNTYGSFSEGVDEEDEPIKWNKSAIKLYGRTTRGVSGALLSYRFSIGYLSISEAKIAQITYAKLVNKAGNVVDVSVDGIQKTMEKREDYLSETLTATLVDDNDYDSYPIAGYSYFIVNMHKMNSCDTAVELTRYVEWMYYNDFAREDAREMKMVPIPETIGKLVANRVFQIMTCEGKAESVYRLVLQQKEDEWWAQQTWRVPLIISLPLVIVLLLALLSYIAWQRIKLRRALLSDEWRISPDKIVIKWSRKWGKSVSTPSLARGSSVSIAMSNMSTASYAWTHSISAVGIWSEKTICLRDMVLPTVYINRTEVKRTLLWFRDKILHPNVLRFYGLSYLDEHIYIVSDNAPKGTLSDVIQNDKYRIDDNIKFSLALDGASGMHFLHSQGLVHGYLTSESCLIDQRWNVRISDWEYYKITDVQNQRRRSRRSSKITPLDEEDDMEADVNIEAKAKYWTAPEILRSDLPNCASKPSDVYSYAVILVEIFTREDPYCEISDTIEPVEIILNVTNNQLRPSLDNVGTDSVKIAISHAWDEDPHKRPSFSSLKKSLRSAKPTRKSVMDCMMEALEGYVTTLEEKVAERTAELANANKSMESLLHQILPPTVANSLSQGEQVTPEAFESVSIFFSDIVGFTKLAADSSPMEIVTMLNDLYTLFDEAIDRHDVYKVETIGDSYMVISGLPNRNGILHAGNVATVALDLIATTDTFKIRHKPEAKMKIRAGIHSGPVVAGVVGTKMPRYCLFGDAVNTASRMESTSLPMQIQISESTTALLNAIGGYKTTERGTMDIKGKGTMKTGFLVSKENYDPLTEINTITAEVHHDVVQRIRSDTHRSLISVISPSKQTQQEQEPRSSSAT